MMDLRDQAGMGRKSQKSRALAASLRVRARRRASGRSRIAPLQIRQESVGSTEASNVRVARVGRIARSFGGPPPRWPRKQADAGRSRTRRPPLVLQAKGPRRIRAGNWCTRHGLGRGCIRISEEQLAEYLASVEQAEPAA